MNRLKELRQEKKLSQKEITLELNIPLRTYQRWENGENQIKQEKAQQLADFFGVSVGYLLGYEDLLDQIEEAESELTKGLAVTKELSQVASSAYDRLFEDALSLLKTLKEAAKVTTIDSVTLIEVVETLEEHIHDLDDAIQKMVTTQIKFIELQNLKKKLNKYKI